MTSLAIRPPPRAVSQPFRRSVDGGGNVFLRFLACQVIAQLRKCDVRDVADRDFPSDRVLEEVVTRAATAPAMTSVAGWAAELVQRVVADGLRALGPASAGAAILRDGLVLSFDGTGVISAPGFVAEFGNAGWVAEGLPIPVRQLATTPATLNPHKLAAIAVLTREMAEGSNAEALIGDALTRAAGRMLDEVLFDANPGDAARPPGLRVGVAATTPSNNSTMSEAVFEDIAALINEVAPVAGSGPYVLVANPGRAAAMAARAYGAFADETGIKISVYGSSAVINDLLMIAPGALVAALSPAPTVETATAATLHMDTVPQPVGSAGPHRSMFQIDSIAIKMRWPVTWALRDPRGFAWMTPAWKAVTPP